MPGDQTMRHAETVTFGGSALDRATDLRSNPDEVQTLIASGWASVVLFWRGKPLVVSPDLDRLARLPADHSILEKGTFGPVLLGREEDGTLVLAYELTDWVPDGVDVHTLGGFVDTSEQQHPDLGTSMSFAGLKKPQERADLIAYLQTIGN